MAESKGKKDEKIVEPTQVDILCGRGGLSNHHPGNEWYRRLIRSNRPLYRACPKHTKLLVSKAIVQAVEQQGGRFLERAKKDGFWYEVSYKRSVDKTSQGLRERERGDEGKDDVVVPVPAQFAGKGGKQAHKLSDLADVAIAQATRMDGLPRSASDMIAQTAARTVPANVPAPHASASTRPPPRKSTAPAPAASSGSGSANTTARKAAPPKAQPAKKRVESKPLSPLPPTMEVRQSSMFRLLKDTKLLPGESTYILGPNTPSGAYHPQNTPHATPTEQQRNSAMHTAAFYNGLQQHGHYGGSPYAAAAAAAAAAGSRPAETTGGSSTAAAPALTRLTTQVSDWLNSFWPVPATKPDASNGGNNNSTPHPGRLSVGSGSAATGTGRVAPPIVNVPPPKDQDGIDITIPPPLKTGNGKLKTKTATEGKVASVARSMPSVVPAPAARSSFKANGIRRISSRTLPMASRKPPPLSPPAASASAATNVDPALGRAQTGATTAAAAQPSSASLGITESISFELGAPPTELEHSVSATLLKLASTPSRFFSGISSLFGEEEPPPPSAPPAGTAASSTSTTTSPPIAGSKRSQGSLLDDDDDDDDDDNKLNAVPRGMKKRRTSLLEDYEETPMEARMRSM